VHLPPGFMPPGAVYPQAATSPSLGQIALQPPGTYHAGALPSGQAPPIRSTPGPTALGPGSLQGSVGTGVQGVGIAPIATVTPPSTAGGPHQLPALPACPLPQGFPNPFDARPANTPPPGSPAPYSPGTTTFTGPSGRLPGLGEFGTPGQGAAPQQQQQPAASPFWLALAWQLLSTTAIREALGEQVEVLMSGPNRLRAIQAAVTVLLTPELQAAFKAVSAGQMQQRPFADLFARNLGPALQQAGLL